ncbi:MAG: alpha/beta hydrolase family protein [Streptosporangiaceae bacterium]
MTPDARTVTVRKAIVVVLAVLSLVSACAGRSLSVVATQAQRGVPSDPAASSTPEVTDIGRPGAYQVGQRRMTFFEPAHTGPTGQFLGQRALVVVIWYPLARRPAGPPAAHGPFPLLVFAPGFMQCGVQYEDLLRAWAGAGYVVAVVNFPRTDCTVGAAAYEPDLVNQPEDMSYALSRLLALSAASHDVLSGLLSQREVAAVGQSDGGDTVATLAADTCCTDHRLKAVAVLSGQEWPPMPGRYFGNPAPPMLFVQGTADTINAPWTSLQLYRADQARARYYLDLFGANHVTPYMGTNPVERLVARVTVAFFDRYVLGQASALATMTREGNVGGTAALVSGGQLPP